ncbi:MAG: gliding motility-associated C-terminal domain-containing protein, partial [Prevotellaceae bacterium]|nr:gliding motility-associated C-terminal domain-containing protein [Prevotellaceae bacterium]
SLNASISGNLFICEAESSVLNGSPAGGIWKSLNPTVATINASGRVTGISAGTADIRYIIGSGNCIDSEEVTVTVYPVYNIDIYDTICIGESYSFNGNSYTTSGIYPFNFVSVSGCDSIITLNLTVLQSCNPQTINVNNDYYELTYGENPFTFTASSSSGLYLTFSQSGTSVNVQNVNVSAGFYNVSIQSVGTTVVKLRQAGNSYYAPTEKTITIEVKPALLTITANSYTINVGDALPELKYTYNKFVYSEDSTVLTEFPILSCSVISNYDAGDYPIIIINKDAIQANNYIIECTDGILSIKGFTGKLSNAFTPYEPDGTNDFFGVGYELYIFNRWGVCLFKDKIGKGWDGRNDKGKMLNPGVYYYYAKDSNGNEYRGSVTLVKRN